MLYPFISVILNFLTAGLILSSDETSLSNLQSCPVYFAFLIKFNSAYFILDLSGSPIAQVWLPYNKVGNAKVLGIVSVVFFFWT